MENQIVEISYPLTFRQDTAKVLGEHLQHQHSVELVGMKRVGINNFLKFFLFHEGVKKQYMPKDGRHFFILVDLNDLIEREIFPFWRLTFKRVVDAVEESNLSEAVKRKISHLFVTSIQSGDLFLTYDSVREALTLLVKENLYPTLFLTRFDRLKNAVTPEFFNNLQALRDATNHKLSYVFTSYRELDGLAPQVFKRKERSLFSSIIYMKPASQKDSKIILQAIAKRYNLELSEDVVKRIVRISGGHVQYLQLALVIMHELTKKSVQADVKALQAIMLSDERVMLQSEELWESLTSDERNCLLQVSMGRKVIGEEKGKTSYLWHTGFFSQEGKGVSVFSPLFASFIKEQGKKVKDGNSVEFSKKEHMLFSILQESVNIICEREAIVEKVWPEYKEYGVSDWSIDRLVARVRNKLKKQKSMYEIQTIRTRGYKLITK